MYNLGAIHANQGRPDDARRWWTSVRTARTRRSPSAPRPPSPSSPESRPPRPRPAHGLRHRGRRAPPHTHRFTSPSPRGPYAASPSPSKWRRVAHTAGPSCAGAMLASLALLLVLLAAPAQAQLIAPGKLTEAHARFEGLSGCTNCHALGQRGIEPQKCLACHTPLRARIRRDEGFHADVDRDCATCHKDHFGRDFDPVRFDTDAFDHRKTGYPLLGEHAGADCQSCHQPRFITAADVRAFKLAAGRLDETYLGLANDCATCHRRRTRTARGLTPTASPATARAGWSRSATSTTLHRLRPRRPARQPLLYVVSRRDRERNHPVRRRRARGVRRVTAPTARTAPSSEGRTARPATTRRRGRPLPTSTTPAPTSRSPAAISASIARAATPPSVGGRSSKASPTRPASRATRTSTTARSAVTARRATPRRVGSR